MRPMIAAFVASIKNYHCCRSVVLAKGAPDDAGRNHQALQNPPIGFPVPVLSTNGTAPLGGNPIGKKMNRMIQSKGGDLSMSSKFRKPARLRNVLFSLPVLILLACSFLGGPAPTTEDSTVGAMILPPVWTQTTTLTPAWTESGPETTSPAVPSPTAYTGTATRKLLPTSRPTPTYGLPPTATLSPREECPPPTHAKVEIEFVYDPDNYAPQIVEYIQARGDSVGLRKQLENPVWHPSEDSGFEEPDAGSKPHDINVYSEDVTGDLVKETLISFQQYDSRAGIHYVSVFVVGCRGRQYQILNNGGTYIIGYFPDSYGTNGIETIQDINADGLREIVLTKTWNTGSAHGDIYYYYNVVEWNGEGFRSLLDLPEASFQRDPTWPETLNLRLELQDVDQNGTTELLFPEQWLGLCGSGPTRTEKRIYMWDGEYYQYMWTDRGAPRYRFEAAFDGDYFSEIALFDKAEASYRQAIDDPSLIHYIFDEYVCTDRKDWEPDDLNTIIAYARFRLVELIVFLQKMKEAESEFSQLVHDFPEQAPGYQYAFLGNKFWETYQKEKNINDACSAVRAEAAKQPDAVFDPIYFGYNNPGPTLETICPFQ
jgi:hypothetical protein